MMTSTEDFDAVDLKTLRPGSLIDVQTKSRHYQIECLGGTTMRISGHPVFCPNPVLAELQGSADRDGSFDSGQIKRGKNLVILLGEHFPVRTSKVVSVHVDRPDSSCRVH